MLPLLMLTLVATTTAISEDCVYRFDNKLYTRTALLTIKGLPSNLAHNPATNDLFFTLIDLDSLTDDEVQTKMDQYVLHNNVPTKIDGVHGQAVAIDKRRNIVYLATDNGLHTLNETYQPTFLSLKDEDIIQLNKHMIKDELYAVLYPDNEVIVLDIKRNEKRPVKNVPCTYIMAVDMEDNVYYECDSIYLKVLLKGFQEPIEFAGIAKDTARAITVDRQNRVILATNDGLYQLKPDRVIPKKLMDLEYWPSGIEFDGDDMYVSTTGVIYKYSNKDCKTNGSKY
ncbi:unnamed protein product [Plutella xylostella]|uniref:(diamondback moth) hypothetical protein n=1 Tax=Plutella xylostella TaxID=51655 RepID=A0A8S4EM38_PLUXY|nr:unnamed protein product [Plutella xylostella]